MAAQFSGQTNAKGLEFETDIDDRLDLELMTDETRLNQVLSNLLSNAIKFTHTGTITLAARQIFASSTRATLQFIVRDTGIGIPPQKHKEIFESFTSGYQYYPEIWWYRFRIIHNQKVSEQVP
ncbi:MAG: hypothetical protein IPP79_05185 [Chitinophagaceae bacterium]|nr:hypothetical protein [Chitinophagaceae bacterium]